MNYWTVLSSFSLSYAFWQTKKFVELKRLVKFWLHLKIGALGHLVLNYFRRGFLLWARRFDFQKRLFIRAILQIKFKLDKIWKRRMGFVSGYKNGYNLLILSSNLLNFRLMLSPLISSFKAIIIDSTGLRKSDDSCLVMLDLLVTFLLLLPIYLQFLMNLNGNSFLSPLKTVYLVKVCFGNLFGRDLVRYHLRRLVLLLSNCGCLVGWNFMEERRFRSPCLLA